jgi:hypothetical protein
LASAFGLALLAFAYPARAESPLSLTWAAPKECPARESVVLAVERLITKPPAKTLVATAIVEKRDERYGADIRTPGGERHLDGESCRAVGEAVAMVLALAIDPEASPSAAAFAAFDEPVPAAQAKPESAVASVAPAAATAPPSRPDKDEPSPNGEPDEAKGARFIAAAFALVESGMLPGPTFGASVDAGVGMTAWSVELGATWLLPREGELEDDSSRGGKIGYLGGHAAGCVTPFRPRRIDFCGAFEVGRIAGTGTGVTNPLTGDALWLAPALFGAARLPLFGHVQGEGRLGAAFALNRPKFSLNDLGEVHQPAPFTVRAELGFSWR